ncbi:Spy/CpxP family protein refolding chaperone [Marinilabilia rubra]|uniref:Periplasmic heavy metal sensor n=1 Tax=Marinilabilia rubra TaxID=2162893 RepID=A0A2U2B900_9BACT|nr:hypothetical protein [Marinilabilia rubra]PWD99514.1 hypothetical protein DDZ16_10960 [Marinilabilia rubra]
MNKKTLIATVLILMAAFIVGWAIQRWFNPFSGSPYFNNTTSSNPAPFTMGAGQGQGFRQMANSLNLSEEQISSLSEIEAGYRSRMHKYMQLIDSIDLAILNELKSNSPNEEKLDSLAVKAGSIQFHLKKATADHFLAIKNLCNPRQKERFNEVISNINKFKRGRGMGKGQGQGMGQGMGRRGQGQGRNRCN